MKLSIGELMDVAHEVASESFGSMSFNFSSLWAKTWAKAKNFKKANLEEWIGSFYVELLLDPRFVYLGPDQWKLRSFMDYSEYLKVVGKRAQEVSLKELEIEMEPQEQEGERVSAEEIAGQVKGAKITAEEEIFEEEGEESSRSSSDSESEDPEDNYE